MFLDGTFYKFPQVLICTVVNGLIVQHISNSSYLCLLIIVEKNDITGDIKELDIFKRTDSSTP